MTLHLHHPELAAGPCNPQLVREEAERVERVERFAADLAWDQREDTACAHLNAAFHAADAALNSLRSPNCDCPAGWERQCALASCNRRAA